MIKKMRLRVLREIRKKMHEAEKIAKSYSLNERERGWWMNQFFALRKFYGTVQYNWTKWAKEEA